MVVSFVLLGTLLLAKGVLSLPDAFKQLAAASNTTAGVGKEQVIALATQIFAIAAAVYLIISTGEKKLEKIRSYLSFTVIAWALLETLGVYFDSARTINSPVKAILLSLTVVNMLFLTEDARFLIGSQKAAMYRAVCSVCVCFGVAFALPNAICAVFGAFGRSTSSFFAAPEGIYDALGFDLMFSLIMLMIPVGAGIRILTAASYLGDYVSPKHEKKAPAPFGEAPAEGKASDLEAMSDGIGTNSVSEKDPSGADGTKE
jgi:hypothetical protein